MQKTNNNIVDISIVIPTYNRASYLPKILDKLAVQIGLEKIKWEVIIVDNNSQDNTAEVINNYQISLNNKINLRYLIETRQGAAFARLKGVKESKGNLIGFLDDDNLPASDWIAESVTFAQKYPQAGAWSGQIHGELEVNPPENFSRIQAFLAIREEGLKPHLFDPDNLKLPPAAALVVRKQAWLKSVPQKICFKGRLGKSMVGGEDLEPILYLYKNGWEIWYNPCMHTYHQIPSHRLEKDYLLTLARGCGLSICQLRLINAEKSQKIMVIAKTFFGNFKRILMHLIKYKFDLKSNLAAQFELEFYFASMISPLYSLILYYNQLFHTSIIMVNE